MTRGACLVALLLLVLPVPPAAARVTVKVLDNGLTVVVKEDHSAPVVAMQAWVRTGSVLEGRHLGSGLSHYFEHMLFKGTKRLGVGEFSSRIQAAGGTDLNAWTSYGETVYHFTVLARHFDLGLQDLADVLTGSTFPEEEVKKEMPVILREMDQGEDEPDQVIWRLFDQTLYQVHPFRQPIIGHKALFQALRREDILEYYRTAYSPSNIVFVIVGQVKTEDALAKVAKEFAPHAPRPLAPVYVPEEPEPLAARYVEKPFHVKQTQLKVGWKTVSVRHPDLAALDVLASVLGTGDSSRLVRTLREEKQLVTEISCASWTPQWPGTLAISAKLDDAQLAAVRAEVDRLVAALREELVGEPELKRAKAKILADLVLENQSASQQAQQLGWAVVVGGDVDFHRTYREGVQRVTAEQVRDVVRRYLAPHRQVTAALRPKEAVKAAAGPAAVPAALPPRLVKLPNGLRIVLRENRAVPAVHLQARGLAGTLFEAPAKSGVNNLMAELLVKGTAGRSAARIAEEIEGVGGRFEASGGKSTFGLTFDLLARDADLGLDLLADCLRRSTFSEEELAKLKKQVLARLAEEETDPWSLNRRLFREAFYGAHPYGRSELGQPETLAALGRADVQAAWKALVHPKNLVLGVYGDFDGARVVERLKSLLGDWEGPEGPQGEWPAAPVPQAPAAKELGKAEFQQTVIRIGFPTVKVTDPERIPFKVLAAILDGMGSRLFIELRDKRSLAYAVGCSSDVQVAAGGFLFYAGTTPAQQAETLAGLKKEIERVGSTITPEELRRAKQTVVGEEVTQVTTNSAQATRAVLDELYGRGYAASQDELAKVEQVTHEEVRRVAEKYFDWRRSTTVIVGPTPPKPADPQGTVEGAVGEALRLLAAGEHRTFLERFVHPDDRAEILKKKTADDWAKEFVTGRHQRVLEALRAAQAAKPELSADGGTATFRREQRDLVLSRKDGRWYLKN